MKDSPYLKILTEKYISLIVIPIVIVSSIFLYAYVKGIVIKSECEVAPSVVFFFYIVFFAIQIIFMLMHISKNNYTEAFGKAIRLIIIFVLSETYIHLLADDFTRKLENFHKEKRYYLRSLSIFKPIKGLSILEMKGASHCVLVYDEYDTLLQDKRHRKDIETIDIFDWGGWARSSQSPLVKSTGKTYHVPTEGYKIEPNFYYMCFDFDKKIELFNDDIKDKE